MEQEIKLGKKIFIRNTEKMNIGCKTLFMQILKN